MKYENHAWSTGTYISAFLLGVLLFWSFGKDWLGFGSAVVFLAGLIGVAVAVLLFGAWKIMRNSDHKGN